MSPLSLGSKTCTLVFHGPLEDFVAAHLRGGPLIQEFRGTLAVKDVIESAGPPHVEVDLVVVNGEISAFDRRIDDGDTVEAFPAGHERTLGVISLTRPETIAPRFLVDENLGRLNQRLRMLGFDSLWNRSWDDAHLAEMAWRERRILLSRDLGLLKRAIVSHGQYVRSDEPDEQVMEVVRRWGIWSEARPFTRCMECNGRLEAVPLSRVVDQVPSRVASGFTEFFRCGGCGKAYWKGSHFVKMESWLAELKTRLVSTRSSRRPC